MECPRCGVAVAADDNFCRKCGFILGEPRALVPAPVTVPDVDWRPVRDLVIRGATALAVGTAVELLRRGARQHLNASALADRVEELAQRRREAVVRRPAPPPTPAERPVRVEPGSAVDGELSVSYTRYIFLQRIQIRR